MSMESDKGTYTCCLFILMYMKIDKTGKAGKHRTFLVKMSMESDTRDNHGLYIS
jgi:hypothetical protein